MRQHRKTMYGDPIRHVIGRLPVIDNKKWVRVWNSKRPHAVYRLRRWYTEHDGRVITLLRAVTAITPAALLYFEVTIANALTVALIGVFTTEILSEKREALQRETWKQELEGERREYWRTKREMDPTLPQY